jgi:hypothetical protein
VFFALNALWEAAQLPLYTLWQRGSWYEITFALVHCTIGDLMIGGTVTAVSAAVLFLLTKWPPKLASSTFLGLFLVLGIAYTAFSEWLKCPSARDMGVYGTDARAAAFRDGSHPAPSVVDRSDPHLGTFGTTAPNLTWHRQHHLDRKPHPSEFISEERHCRRKRARQRQPTP